MTDNGDAQHLDLSSSQPSLRVRVGKQAVPQDTHVVPVVPAETDECQPQHSLESYGFNPLPKRGVKVTNALVNKLRDELGI